MCPRLHPAAISAARPPAHCPHRASTPPNGSLRPPMFQTRLVSCALPCSKHASLVAPSPVPNTPR
eukprot:7263713-Prymnesium_polylepis.1